MKLEKDSGNIKIIILVAVVVLMIIIGIIFLGKPKNKKYEEIKKEPFEYFVLNSLDGKVGVIDKTGSILVNAEYTNIYIPNQSKDVFICYKNDTDYIILNKEGNEILNEYEAVYAIQISESTNEMEQDVLCYVENDNYGLIDFSGKKITNAIYEEVVSLPNKPG